MSVIEQDSADAHRFFEHQLNLACQNNEPQLAELFFKKIEPNYALFIVEQKNLHYAREAAAKGETEIVKFFISVSPVARKFVGNFRSSSLLNAWLNNRLDTAVAICDDLQLDYESVSEIVHYAYEQVCARGHDDIAKDVYHRFGDHILNPLSIACGFGMTDLAFIICETDSIGDGEIMSALYASIMGGYTETAELLVRKFPWLKKSDGESRCALTANSGRACLAVACKKRHSEIVFWAIDKFSLKASDFNDPIILESLSANPGLTYGLIQKMPDFERFITLKF